MPAIITHYILGEDILATISEDESFPKPLREEFLWGCQGPDVAFFHRLLPWKKGKPIRKFGSAMHIDKPSAIFSALLEKCRESGGPELISYALGFCCHYGFDSVAHPYINWCVEEHKRSDRRGEGYKYHGEIESMLDTIMLRRYLGKLPQEMELTECLPTSAGTSETIAEMFIFLLSRLYDVRLSRESALQLVPDMLTAFRMLTDRHALKRPALRALETLLSGAGVPGGAVSAYMRKPVEELSFDYANISHTLWHNPDSPSEVSREDFFELYERAHERTLMLLGAFVSGLEGGAPDFAALTGERTFSSGAAVPYEGEGEEAE